METIVLVHGQELDIFSVGKNQHQAQLQLPIQIPTKQLSTLLNFSFGLRNITMTDKPQGKPESGVN